MVEHYTFHLRELFFEHFDGTVRRTVVRNNHSRVMTFHGGYQPGKIIPEIIHCVPVQYYNGYLHCPNPLNGFRRIRIPRFRNRLRGLRSSLRHVRILPLRAHILLHRDSPRGILRDNDIREADIRRADLP